MSRQPLMDHLVVILFLTLSVSGAYQAPATAQRYKGGELHPHIRSAIRELEEARRELETAAHDFRGHRKEAIEAVDNALGELRQALEYDKRSAAPPSWSMPVTGINQAATVSAYGGSRDNYSHIRAAIRELRAARQELESAAHDFGGHRREALEAVDYAIKVLSEVEEGNPPPYPTPTPKPRP